ncbi:MAG: SOS response-associated peptidase [Chryseosolibacter sp.]
MIDRYSITASAKQISERFSVDVPEFYKEHYNASPTQLLPVITSASPEGVSLFYWGTAPDWAKNKTVSEKLINLRAEHFAEKPTLQKSMRTQRCIIPADGFYGWKKVGKKTSIPFRFVIKTKGIFSFPALWEEFEDTDGHQIQTFTIITVPADHIVNTVQERMPVILNRQTEKVWLDKESAEENLLEILSSKESTEINYYPVSPRISQMDVDVPSLIVPTPPADQHGNLTLFD